MNRTILHPVLGGLLILALAACGGSDPEPVVDNGLAEFENQEVSWEACDPNLFGSEFYELLAPVRERLECATLKTPLDWNEPELDEINLGVLRVRAGNEAERKGAILMNPGGPGGDGLTLGALFGLIFTSGGSPDIGYPTPASELFTQISDQYDIVGFSPRGVGGSFQLFCGSNATLPPANFYTDRSEENVQALLETARISAEACLNNPLSKYIDTEQTVRDMNLIRQLLGDEKLNFFGYSYGSWLGAWYAKLFPQHSGNIVLDSNVDFSSGWQRAEFDFAMGFDRAFREVALPYAARNDAVYALGSSAEEVDSVYEALPRELKGALVTGQMIIPGDLYDSRNVVDIAIKLISARGVQAVLGDFGPITEENVEAFFAELASYTYADTEELNETARDAAVVLGEDYLGFLASSLAGDASARDIVLEPGGAVGQVVLCNDAPFNQDPDFWADKGDEFNQLYPLIGGSRTVQPCAFWSGPTASMPEVPENIPPILMVQTGFDAPTPSEAAVRAFRSLPDARFVYVENEMDHAIFPYNTPCVDEKVAAYLLDGTLPEQEVSSCAAEPLPGENQVYPPGGVPSFDTQSLSTQAAQTPGPNPLYDLVHDMIRENAADFFGH